MTINSASAPMIRIPRDLYFRGYLVTLTGRTEILYGGLFYEGIYAAGPSKGRRVDIAERLVLNASAK